MEAQAYMDALGRALNTTVELDENNNAIIDFEEASLFILWRNEMQSFQMQIAVGEPNAQNPNIFKKLLAANFLLQDTFGTSLSYNETIDTVFLENIIHINSISDEEFVKEVEVFVRISDIWADKLSAMNEEEENTSTADMKELFDENIHADLPVNLLKI